MRRKDVPKGPCALPNCLFDRPNCSFAEYTFSEMQVCPKRGLVTYGCIGSVSSGLKLPRWTSRTGPLNHGALIITGNSTVATAWSVFSRVGSSLRCDHDKGIREWFDWDRDHRIPDLPFVGAKRNQCSPVNHRTTAATTTVVGFGKVGVSTIVFLRFYRVDARRCPRRSTEHLTKVGRPNQHFRMRFRSTFQRLLAQIRHSPVVSTRIYTRPFGRWVRNRAFWSLLCLVPMTQSKMVRCKRHACANSVKWNEPHHTNILFRHTLEKVRKKDCRNSDVMC